MSNSRFKIFLPLIVAAVLSCASVFGQGDVATPKTSTPSAKPLLQDIQVYKEPSNDGPGFVQKTGSTTPAVGAAGAPLNLVKSSFPILAETPIPGYSGVLVETMEGNVVVESMSNVP